MQALQVYNLRQFLSFPSELVKLYWYVTVKPQAQPLYHKTNITKHCKRLLRSVRRAAFIKSVSRSSARIVLAHEGREGSKRVLIQRGNHRFWS